MNKVLVLTMVKNAVTWKHSTDYMYATLVENSNKQKQNRENLRELLDLILVVLVLFTFFLYFAILIATFQI